MTVVTRAAQGRPARKPWGSCLLASALLLALQAGGAPLRLALRFERDAVLDGQWWRLFTAHVVHLSWAHCLLNVAGLWLLAASSRHPMNTRVLAWHGLALGGGVSVLLLAATRVPDYAGLSGVLYGLFTLELLPSALNKDRPAALALAAVAGWASWQAVAGPLSSEAAMIGGHIVAAAHVFGIGLALGWLGLRCLAEGRRP